MRPRSTTTRRLEEAKLGVVHRFGEALREISRRHQDRTGPAYEEIFDIGCGNDSYPVGWPSHRKSGSAATRHSAFSATTTRIHGVRIRAVRKNCAVRR